MPVVKLSVIVHLKIGQAPLIRMLCLAFAAQTGRIYNIHFVGDLLNMFQIAQHRLKHLFQVERGDTAFKREFPANVVPCHPVEIVRILAVTESFLYARMDSRGLEAEFDHSMSRATCPFG